MGKKRHTAEEIVSKLRQVDVLTAQGRSVAEAKLVPGADLACGVGTDQLAPVEGVALADVRAVQEMELSAARTLFAVVTVGMVSAVAFYAWVLSSL